MGLSTTKQKTKTSENRTEQASTTPTNPGWVTDALQQHTANIGAWANNDPSSLVTGPTSLQQRAFNGAGRLGDWQRQLNNMGTRANTAEGFTMDGAQLGGAQGYNATQLGNPMLSQGVNMGAAGQANTSGYQATLANGGGNLLGDAAQAKGGFLGEAGQAGGVSLGRAPGYQAAQAARTQLGGAQGYGVANYGNVAHANAERATASQGAGYMDDYLNPYTEQVVDTTLADMDENAGTIRAQQAANAARNGGFGGSRFAIQEAQTEGELGRARAASAAGLRSNAFNTAAGLGMGDADRFAQTSGLNAQLGTQTNIANTGFDNEKLGRVFGAKNDASAFGANARNQFSMAQGQMDAANNQFNTGQTNDGRQFNAAQAGQFAMAQGQMDLANNQFNTGQTNQFGLERGRMEMANNQFNTGQTNQFGMERGRMDMANNQFNAGLQTQASRDYADAANTNSRFNVGEDARMRQAQGQMDLSNNQTNAGLSRDYALDQAGRSDAASRYGAEAGNQFALQQGQFNQSTAASNMAAQNQSAQFNAGQMDAARQAQFQRIGMIADGSRQDIGMAAELGGQQRSIEQQRALAPLMQLEAAGQLYGQTPFDLFRGQNVNGTSSMTGTSTTTGRPSLFSQLLQMGGMAAQAYSGGAG